MLTWRDIHHECVGGNEGVVDRELDWDDRATERRVELEKDGGVGSTFFHDEGAAGDQCGESNRAGDGQQEGESFHVFGVDRSNVHQTAIKGESVSNHPSTPP